MVATLAWSLLGNSIKVQMWNVLDMRSLDDSKVRKGWFVDFCWFLVASCRVWMTKWMGDKSRQD